MVLSSPRLKACYDARGAEGLLEREGWQWDGDAEGVFERFFGTDNPFAALGAMQEATESAAAAGVGGGSRAGKAKVYAIEASLEECFAGTTKRALHKRKVVNEFGAASVEDAVLTIAVAPGAAAGTRYVFEGAGSRAPGVEAGPVVYVLEEAEHARFAREGDDLVHEARLPLYKALAGTTLELTGIDGKALCVSVGGVVCPGDAQIVRGAGMPKAGGGRGDLKVVFDVVFPSALSATQKELLKAAFFLPEKVSPGQQAAVDAFLAAFGDFHSGWAGGFKVAKAVAGA